MSTSYVANGHRKILEEASKILSDVYKLQYEYLDGLLDINDKCKRNSLLYKYWKLYPGKESTTSYIQYLKNKYSNQIENKIRRFLDFLKEYPRTFKYTLSIDDETYFTVSI